MNHTSLYMIALLLLFCLHPSAIAITTTTSPLVQGSILHVGGGGPNNYTTIQEAIDDAVDGDTIFIHVRACPYFEHLTIDKSIDVIGEDKHAVLIDGSGEQRVITIRGTEEVSVSRCTIARGGTPEVFGYGIEIYDGVDVCIYDCIITDNNEGIHLNINTMITKQSGEISLLNNTITHNSIGVYGENPCTITGNIIANNTVGLDLAEGSKIIASNEFRDNDIGIQTYNVKQSTIAENNFIQNRIHTKLLKVLPVLLSPLLLSLRIHWERNYWDTWNSTTPRPIIGVGVLYVYLIIIQQPVLIFPTIQFDTNPVLEPYDVGG